MKKIHQVNHHQAAKTYQEDQRDQTKIFHQNDMVMTILDQSIRIGTAKQNDKKKIKLMRL